ncbi:MAG: hypothetical protein LWX07_01170 [Bacteroidetes bacterium]|nr:hypothetical protein [Bacteroidota bacterium]
MKKLLLILLGAAFLCSAASAQDIGLTTKKNKPLLTIETSGSFDLPIMDLKGGDGIRGVWAFQDYGTNIGFGSALNFKFAAYQNRRIQIRPYITFGYSHFVNDDTRAFAFYNSNGEVSYGFPFLTEYTSVQTLPGVSNLRMNMPYLALGCELGVYTDRDSRSSFNFGLDYNFNVITGRIYQTINGHSETYTTYESNLRTGLGANVSYSYKFQDYLGFHVGTRFTMPNLFGKTSEMTDASWYMYLLDKANTSLNPNLSGNRNIAYFKFYGGLSLFFGKL